MTTSLPDNYRLEFRRTYELEEFEALAKIAADYKSTPILGLSDWGWFSICLVSGSMVAGGYLLLIKSDLSLGPTLIVYFIGFATYFTFAAVLGGQKTQKINRAYFASEGEHLVSIDRSGIRVQSLSYDTNSKWSGVTDIQTYEQGILITFSDPAKILPIAEADAQGTPRDEVLARLQAWKAGA